MIDLKDRKFRAGDLLERSLGVVASISSDTATLDYSVFAHQRCEKLIASIRDCIDEINRLPDGPDSEKKSA